MASESSEKKGKKEPRKLPEGFKPDEIVLYPHSAEKSVRMTGENKMAFIVSRKATKNTVKMAVEALYGVKVLGVRTVNAFDGRKKAFVTLSPETPASELASKLGML